MFDYLTGFDHDVFDQFERMRRQMDVMFGDRGGPLGIRSVAAGTYPAINVGASPTQVDVYVFAAGADPKSLDISLQQNLLTLSGERETELPEGAQAYRRERFNGSFKRVITLPEDVDPDKVNAAYRDGVLHITVQRKEELQPRKIEVK
ncbi:Hsp20/alpha crystallin family protein [Marinobacter sp.]|uniref:Hsp20/alpha crystallin family protein n=1 Tax=Marinobacter sp. TaxID=50741 RepID=UPI001B40C679|nr:Hsp20/alpha crystallin family protein [Marinobacter sp.]MBQ0834129.1 Hsp20/alpha crystallin family protein [Marinobacter sp.]